MKKKVNYVLLVDDNEADNYFHSRILKESGITDHVEIAMDGEEALDFLIAKGKEGVAHGQDMLPELIFLDINMPVMDGWTFLEEYDKLDDVLKSRIVVVMLTTSVNPSDKKRAEKWKKTVSFLYKPLTLEMIHEVMQKYFSDYL
ncbi:MAG: response regulator [Bacteroidales bacterium]